MMKESAVRNKLLLTLAASALAVGAVSTDAAFAAKSKSSEPLPFSSKEKANGAKYHPEILKEFGGAYQSPKPPMSNVWARKLPCSRDWQTARASSPLLSSIPP
jgi:predicted Zn-dependent protease